MKTKNSGSKPKRARRKGASSEEPTGMDERFFECYSSRARIGGERIEIDSQDSIEIKQSAVFHGMTRKDGIPKTRLTWLEQIIVLMRSVTTGEEFNHEWWANEISKPKWARSLDKYYGDSWLYYPDKQTDLTPKKLGNKLGYTLSLEERRFELATSKQAFLEKWEAAEVEKARRGFDPEEAKKVRLVLTGYEDWKEFASAGYSSLVELRKTIFNIATERGTREEFADFMAGFSAGEKRARAVDLASQFSEFNEQQEVAEILQDHWLEIEELRDRTQISELVREYLSEAQKRRFIVKTPRGKELPYKESPQCEVAPGIRARG